MLPNPKGAILIVALLVQVPASPLGAQQAGLRGPRAAVAAPAPEATSELALELINSAVRTAESCDAVSEGFLLLIAGDAITGMDPVRAQDYYAKSFEVAQGLGQSGARRVLQQSVVARMAGLDLDRAVELLEKADTPDITLEPRADVRSNLARTLVTQLLNTGASNNTDKALMLLQYLGDTGQYPYSAAEVIVDYFHRNGFDERAAELLSEAVNRFRNDDRFESSPSQFVELIVEAEGKVPKSALVDAIRTAVAGANADERSGNREQTQAKSSVASEFELPILRRRAYVIENLLPVASRIDSSTAEELRNLRAGIEQTIAKLAPRAPAGASGSPRRAASAGTMGQEADRFEEEKPETLVQEVMKLADQKPLEALTLAERIEAPGFRGQALAAVGKSLAHSDPPTAVSALQLAEDSARLVDHGSATSLEDVEKATGMKVEALAEIADAWISLGNRNRAWALASEGFTEVLGFVNKQAVASSKVSSGLDGPAIWLGRLARLEAGLNVAQAAKHAESISSPRLRAYALLSVAIEILQPRPH